jgi:endonuclease-3
MPKGRAARRGPVKPKSAADTRRIMAKLSAQHPNADTELHFENAYQLLVATILSAQCTDERVNQVTPALFQRYPDAHALARATTAELEPQIQSTGFFRAKSRSLAGMSRALVEKHGGQIPPTMDALTKLPGVGRKTANVVLGHALGVPGLPVDRHVLRVANRLGIARSEDPEIVEQQLCAAMPAAEWTRTSDTLILHGRRICKPRPLCDRCAVRDDCDYFRSLKTALLAPSKRPQSAARGAGRSGPATMHPVTGKAIVRRGPEARGTGRPDVAPSSRAESGKPAEVRRGRDARGTGRPDAVPSSRAESGKPAEVRRGRDARGTGRADVAPSSRAV